LAWQKIVADVATLLGWVTSRLGERRGKVAATTVIVLFAAMVVLAVHGLWDGGEHEVHGRG